MLLFRGLYDMKRSKWGLIQYFFPSNGSNRQSLSLTSRRVSGKSGQEGAVTNSVEEQALESRGVEETGLPTDFSEVGPSETSTAV